MIGGFVLEGSKSRLFFCVVEDDPVVADVTRQMLEEAGNLVTVHLSSLEAESAIAELKPCFDHRS